MALHKERERQGIHEPMIHHKSAPRDLLYPEALMEGDLILQVSPNELIKDQSDRIILIFHLPLH